MLVDIDNLPLVKCGLSQNWRYKHCLLDSVKSMSPLKRCGSETLASRLAKIRGGFWLLLLFSAFDCE